MELSKRDLEIIFNEISNPSKPNKALIDGIKSYNAMVEEVYNSDGEIDKVNIVMQPKSHLEIIEINMTISKTNDGESNIS